MDHANLIANTSAPQLTEAPGGLVSATQNAEPAALFACAREFALNRDFEGQSSVLRSILAHPRVNPSELAYASIQLLDIRRRIGRPGEALEGLSAISPQADPSIEFRRIFAITEAHKGLWIGSGDRSHLLKTMECRRGLLAHCGNHKDDIAADLIAYAYEGFLSDKIDAAEFDEEIDSSLQRYEQIAATIKDNALRSRAEHARLNLSARIEFARENFEESFKYHVGAFAKTNNDSYKAYCAIGALQSLLRCGQEFGPTEKSEPFVQFLLDRYKANPQNVVELKNDLIGLAAHFPQLAILADN